jgi:hypothetical protein
MQHKAAIGLHRATGKDLLVAQIIALETQIHFCSRPCRLSLEGLLIIRPSAPRSLCSHR